MDTNDHSDSLRKAVEHAEELKREPMGNAEFKRMVRAGLPKDSRQPLPNPPGYSRV